MAKYEVLLVFETFLDVEAINEAAALAKAKKDFQTVLKLRTIVDEADYIVTEVGETK